MSTTLKKIHRTFSRLPESKCSSQVQLAIPGAVTLKDFKRLIPLVDYIMGSSCDGYIAVRADDMNAVYVSRGYARLIRGETMELEGTPCFSMLGRDGPCSGCLGAEAVEHIDMGEKSVVMHHRFKRNPGVYRTRFVPIQLKDAGIFIKSVTISDDARLEALARMASLGEVAGPALHDMNNLASGIAGYAGLLQRTMSSGMHNEAKGIVDELARQAETVMRFCSNIANVASGRRTPFPADVEMSIGDLIKIARKSIAHSEKNAMVDVCYEGGNNGLMAWAVPGDLQRLFLNIVINAIEHGYGPEDTGRVVVRVLPSQSHVIIEIENDGKMIPYEIREALLSRPVSSPIVKHGFGLYFSTRAIKEFGGDVSYESEPGRTVFRIMLPKYDGNLSGIGHGVVS